MVEKEHSRHKALMAVLVRRVGGEKRREKEQRESKRAEREDDTSGSLGLEEDEYIRKTRDCSEATIPELRSLITAYPFVPSTNCPVHEREPLEDVL